MNQSEQREEAVFEAALQLPADQRAAYLDQACACDAGLRRRVEMLLGAFERAGSFMKQPATPERTVRHSPAPTEKPGDRIGRYKLLEQIGEGGCGVVYVAEQEEPLRRRVALKVIKLGMDTKQVIARFEAERQALAIMDHPNIAKIFDAGVTETPLSASGHPLPVGRGEGQGEGIPNSQPSTLNPQLSPGRPYFVMELVRGIKITEFCDKNKVSTEDRLKLFIQVCQAIQHAHQKGVIHRDIKPSNILVTLHDGVPVPKVIDFGIAKATQGRLTDQTVYTAFEQFIGTPAYMSPEQAELSGLDIDTRSDIYSLGVLLYELLTGRTPFDAKELMAAGLDAMRRTIREVEPIKPSTRLTQEMNRQRGKGEWEKRGSEAASHSTLNHNLSTDLDWIVMKSLDKDRARRYETASALAMDVERHLHDEPVMARPPSSLYRLQKSVRRNKTAFGAATAIAAVLVIGVAVSTWQALRATRAQRQQIVLREAAEQARAKEASQRLEAEQARTREAAARREAEAQAYSSDMNLAQQALSADNFGGAQDLLNRHRPQPGQSDRRGWEWRYLWQQCRSDAAFTLCDRSNPVRSLSVSPDGRLIAVGEQHDGKLSVWNLSARHELAHPSAGDGEVIVAFSRQGSVLAFSVSEGAMSGAAPRYEVRLWDTALEQALPTRISLGGPCLGLGFSLDGKTLITLAGGPNSQLALWLVSDGTEVATRPERETVSFTVPYPFAISPDASMVAYRVSSSRFRVVELPTCKERWTTPVAKEGWGLAVAFSRDGKLLATGSGVGSKKVASIHLWDIASGSEVKELHGHSAWISSLVFWPDGKTLASASADQTVRVWDIQNIANVPPPRTLHGHRNEVWGLATLPHKQHLVSGGKDGSVCVWNPAEADRPLTSVTLPASVVAWRFADSGHAALTLNEKGDLEQWQGDGFLDQRTLFALGSKEFHSLFSEDGRWLATGSSNGNVRVWNVLKRELGASFTADTGEVIPLKFLLGGTRLVVHHRADDSSRIWDLAGSRQVWSWKPNVGDRTRYAFSPNGSWCVTLGWNGASSRVDLVGCRDAAAGLDTKQAFELSFSPNGKLLAAASALGFARLWEVFPAHDSISFREVATLRGFRLGAHSIAFSPDSRRLATGGGGVQGIRIWDLESLHDLLTLEAGHSQQLLGSGTAFSADGNALGCLSDGGTLRLWLAPSPTEITAAEEGHDEKQ